MIKSDWQAIFEAEMEKGYYQKLMEFIDYEYDTKIIYPLEDNIFRAFELTGFHETKVVILGQDPYHGPNQAHGLSFSVASPEAKFPPSLRNMFKELEDDIGVTRTNKDLSDWAEQGVLLLNTVLTVMAGTAGSHRKQGWEVFTGQIISELNEREAPVVFVLWGADAQKKESLITNGRHKIIKTPHPSPLSAYRGFFGSRPYSQINAYLREIGKAEIKWANG